MHEHQLSDLVHEHQLSDLVHEHQLSDIVSAWTEPLFSNKMADKTDIL